MFIAPPMFEFLFLYIFVPLKFAIELNSIEIVPNSKPLLSKNYDPISVYTTLIIFITLPSLSKNLQFDVIIMLMETVLWDAKTPVEDLFPLIVQF